MWVPFLSCVVPTVMKRHCARAASIHFHKMCAGEFPAKLYSRIESSPSFAALENPPLAATTVYQADSAFWLSECETAESAGSRMGNLRESFVSRLPHVLDPSMTFEPGEY